MARHHRNKQPSTPPTDTAMNDLHIPLDYAGHAPRPSGRHDRPAVRDAKEVLFDCGNFECIA
jgi:hypothetical protein